MNRASLSLLLGMSALASGCHLTYADFAYRPTDGGTSDGGTDAGGRDGGESADDAGTDGSMGDGCTPRTFFLDTDNDNHGDPEVSRVACAAPEGYVALGDDCNDALASIRPGASEICDGIDQDCDGTVDEGLLGPLGAPIPVAGSLGFGLRNGVDLAVHDGGYVVAWKRDADDSIFASFFDASGDPVRTNRSIAGDPTNTDVGKPSVSIVRQMGIDLAAFTWTDGNQIRVAATSLTGASGLVDHIIVDLGSEEVLTHEAVAVGGRLAVRWTARQAGGFPGQSSISIIDPVTGELSETLDLPSDDSAEYSSLTAVEGDVPFLLTVRRTLDVAFARLEILSIDITDPPSLGMNLSWDYSGRCDGAWEGCSATLAVDGQGRTESPSLVVTELTFDTGFSGRSTCVYPATPTSSGLTLGDCVDMGGGSGAATWRTTRGATGMVLSSNELGDWIMQEIPLHPATAGSGPTSVSAYRDLGFARVGVVARSDRVGLLSGGTSSSPTLIRWGCEP